MPSDTLVVWGIGLAIMVLTTIPFVLLRRRTEAQTAAAQLKAKEEGLDIPASLHPVIDVERCIGTASCLSACPEQDILGLRSGQAVSVSPANCIGHGLCERSCPVDAIQLVFGTEKRGVDIPRIKGNFESNVPGLFVVGELGGMGLIKNAFEQGRQCVEGIAKRLVGPVPDGVLDIIIVGCGPAGLSAALTAQDSGLTLAVLEREDVGGTVRHYPRKKLVMTDPVKVPGYGRVGAREIIKENLIEIWEAAVEQSGLRVTTHTAVTDVSADPDGMFTVATAGKNYRSRYVILAIGRRGIPRKLGIPGEDLPNVSYGLREPEAFQGDRIVIVGGGDSAVEAGLALAAQPGNDVRIAYRGTAFSRAKPKNRQKAEEAVRNGKLTVLWSTKILENGLTQVVAREPEQGPSTLPNDQLFVFAGGELPTPFLERCGVAIDTKFGEP
jgi:thioredoxin reductase/NAD-dependent dihydropyrimidine dehydrogenase PreA subunit